MSSRLFIGLGIIFITISIIPFYNAGYKFGAGFHEIDLAHNFLLIPDGEEYLHLEINSNKVLSAREVYTKGWNYLFSSMKDIGFGIVLLSVGLIITFYELGSLKKQPQKWRP